MRRVFPAIAIGSAIALAGITAYFAIPAGYSPQLPSFLQASAAPPGPTTVLVFAVDEDRLRDDRLEEAAFRMAATLREATPSIRYSGRGVRNGVITITLVDGNDRQRALDMLEAATARTDEPELTISPSASASNVIEARLAPGYLQSLTLQGATQSMEVIRRRVDPTGRWGAELSLTQDHRVVLPMRGAHNTEALRRLIGQGLLTFHLVRTLTPQQVSEGRAPPGAMLVEPYPEFANASVEAVEQRPSLTGDHLARAEPQTNVQTGEWVLAFSLDAEGTRLFCRITRDNVGERLAILLDNRVLTAPLINEPICGGSGQISGNFTAQSANELAIMLNAGALPAPLLLVDERIDGNAN